jgi:hypothetical protein
VRSCGFCRSMFPRARPGTPRTPQPPNLRLGRLPDLDRVASIEGNHRKGSWSGVEEDRSSTFPADDCSSRRLGPDLDRSGRLLSRPSLSRPVRSDAGREGYRHRIACLHGSRTTGPCDAELPRRNPTFTNPRHLPSRDRSRTNEGSCRSASRAAVRRRLFHRLRARAGDARTRR